jgi:hypothetical protein
MPVGVCEIEAVVAGAKFGGLGKERAAGIADPGGPGVGFCAGVCPEGKHYFIAAAKVGRAAVCRVLKMLVREKVDHKAVFANFKTGQYMGLVMSFVWGKAYGGVKLTGKFYVFYGQVGPDLFWLHNLLFDIKIQIICSCCFAIPYTTTSLRGTKQSLHRTLKVWRDLGHTYLCGYSFVTSLRARVSGAG